jgi:carboxylesterase type B
MLYSVLPYFLPWASVAVALNSNLGPVVDLGYAAFAGNATQPGVHFFGGIPYAEPPLGNLRFRAPRALNEKNRAKAVQDARNWGPLCIQQPAVVGIGNEGAI